MATIPEQAPPTWRVNLPCRQTPKPSNPRGQSYSRYPSPARRRVRRLCSLLRRAVQALGQPLDQPQPDLGGGELAALRFGAAAQRPLDPREVSAAATAALDAAAAGLSSSSYSYYDSLPSPSASPPPWTPSSRRSLGLGRTGTGRGRGCSRPRPRRPSRPAPHRTREDDRRCVQSCRRQSCRQWRTRSRDPAWRAAWECLKAHPVHQRIL